MNEQQIRDAGGLISVPFEAPPADPDRLKYADLGKGAKSEHGEWSPFEMAQESLAPDGDGEAPDGAIDVVRAAVREARLECFEIALVAKGRGREAARAREALRDAHADRRVLEAALAESESVGVSEAAFAMASRYVIRNRRGEWAGSLKRSSGSSESRTAVGPSASGRRAPSPANASHPSKAGAKQDYPHQPPEMGSGDLDPMKALDEIGGRDDWERLIGFTPNDFKASSKTEGDPHLLDRAATIAEKISPRDLPTEPASELAKRVLHGHVDTQAKWTEGYTPDGALVYKAERRKVHQAILDHFLDGHKPNPGPDGKPRVLLTAGGMASGKGSAKKMPDYPDLMPPDAVEVNPDEIKAMLPEWDEMAGDPFVGSALHEESSDISKMLIAEAMRRGLNVFFDASGNGKPASGDRPGRFAEKVREFTDGVLPTGGKTENAYAASIIYVNTPAKVAQVRAARRGFEEGRWVPTAALLSNHENVSANVPEIMGLVRDGVIARVVGYDNRAGNVVKMFSGEAGSEPSVDDEPLYREFLDKAKKRK